jgi:DNA-binding CsgD family transcriptional regulator
MHQDSTPHPASGRPGRLAALLLFAVAGTGAMDLLLDGAEARSSVHFWMDVAILILSLTGCAYFWSGWRREGVSLARAEGILNHQRAERDEWKRRAEAYLRGLGEAIDTQFRAWGLTAAECETGILLLKGLSHKEIAAACGRSERTVRQHAIAVYRKSGLEGRTGLSAYFLEDLLLPGTGQPAMPMDNLAVPH